MTHDPKLVEFLVERLELFDPTFVEEFLDAIDASGIAWIAPWEPSETMIDAACAVELVWPDYANVETPETFKAEYRAARYVCLWKVEGLPSSEGVKRYPPDGMYLALTEDAQPCTCMPQCPRDCKGQCGCEACDYAYNDYLSMPQG